MQNQKCALCDTDISTDSKCSLCKDCIKTADCCIGLEKIR